MIKPMTIAAVRANLPHLFELASRERDKLTQATAMVALSAIKAWAEARAWARMAEFQNLHQSPGLCERDDCLFGNSDSTHKGREWMFSDWLNSVLDEIGWQKDDR